MHSTETTDNIVTIIKLAKKQTQLFQPLKRKQLYNVIKVIIATKAIVLQYKLYTLNLHDVICHIFLLKYSCFIMLLVSAVQQTESATCIHISCLPWISFPFGSPQSFEQNSLCYIVHSYQLFHLVQFSRSVVSDSL